MFLICAVLSAVGVDVVAWASVGVVQAVVGPVKVVNTVLVTVVSVPVVAVPVVAVPVAAVPLVAVSVVAVVSLVVAESVTEQKVKRTNTSSEPFISES